MDVVVLLSPDHGATSTSSSTTNVVEVLALYYPLVKLLRDAPHSEVTRPRARFFNGLLDVVGRR